MSLCCDTRKTMNPEEVVAILGPNTKATINTLSELGETVCCAMKTDSDTLLGVRSDS